ncbi:MAG: hypothetical protein ABIS01_13935 [Ferruginibacter sp.]
MKTILSFVILLLGIFAARGQGLSVDNLFSVISFSAAKCENQLSDRGFALTGKELRNDTSMRIFDYRRTKHFKTIDSISRCLKRADTKEDCYITYETASYDEFRKIITEIKNEGFYCNQVEQGNNPPPLLYQNKDLTVQTKMITTDGNSMYSLQFHKKIFPRIKDIYYANDLLIFTSHEYLTYFFGEKNVREDFYIFGKNQTIKCTVLFLNTNRQAVFIWADELNRCGISSILFGGQLNLKSSMESGKYVEQNNWALKSGVRPGMSLLELRMRNGNDFRFYGGNSGNSGLVIPANDGKLDFKKEEIILGCLNCRDDKFNSSKVINADDSIDEGRILFVLSVMLNPL